MTKHPFRFGIQLRGAATAAEWKSNAIKAEALGYSTLFLPDHFDEAWSPTVPLAVAASVTTTLKVGALVYDNDYRHPLVLARDVAALDFLSEGRVEFGIGAGWMTTDYQQSGISLDTPGVRIERMEEALQIITQLWAEPTASFTGKHYNLSAAKVSPRPHSVGGPPIIVGGGGKKVLGIAAKYASIIGVNPELTSGTAGVEAAQTAVSQRYLERIEWIKNAAGERFSEIELQILCQFEQITDDREALYESISPIFGLTPTEAADVPIVLAGTPSQIIDDLVERREKYGFSYIVVHDIEGFAPVVNALAGR